MPPVSQAYDQLTFSITALYQEGGEDAKATGDGEGNVLFLSNFPSPIRTAFL